MKSRIIKTNYTNVDLWCIYSKERIRIGEKYILVFERYRNEWIEKAYKVEYREFIDEE